MASRLLPPLSRRASAGLVAGRQYAAQSAQRALPATSWAAPGLDLTAPRPRAAGSRAPAPSRGRRCAGRRPAPPPPAAPGPPGRAAPPRRGARQRAARLERGHTRLLSRSLAHAPRQPWRCGEPPRLAARLTAVRAHVHTVVVGGRGRATPRAVASPPCIAIPGGACLGHGDIARVDGMVLQRAVHEAGDTQGGIAPEWRWTSSSDRKPCAGQDLVVGGKQLKQ